LTIRVSDREHRAIRDRANEIGLSVSDLLRGLALDDLLRQETASYHGPLSAVERKREVDL